MVPGGRVHAGAHTPTTSFSLWHKPERLEDPFSSYQAKRNVENGSPSAIKEGERKPTDSLKTKELARSLGLSNPASQPLLSTHLPPNSTRLRACWLGFYLPCRHFSYFKVSINSPLMCPKRIFKGLETHK